MGPRKAVVRVGEPVNLRDHFAAYKTGKRVVAQKVTATLESSVRTMLEALCAQAHRMNV